MNNQTAAKEHELPKAYEAKLTDSKWNAFWEKHALFQADPDSDKPPFCIVIPPPNITGKLHMGHALVNTLQDIIIRWKRMQGFEALWVPGTDHAGISTQTTVEKHLIRKEGKGRKDYTREAFLEKIWQWKADNESEILNQLKLMGCSCDWTKLRFTMDEKNNRSVRTMFKKLYDEGLIYRGDYLVNWDPVTQTALADDEVEYEERSSYLWHIKYPLKDGSGFIEIATTRPETMLGDTAVAVSPKDERYKAFHGKTLVLPLTQREIPIITDNLVDPEFGTGAVKVTPAHDPNDYQMGLSHNLPFINIMTPDGRINENGGAFSGLPIAEAREAVVEELKRQGFLVKAAPHMNRVGVSYRSKAVIEPYMSKQWFVKMSAFKQTMRDEVEKGSVAIVPKNWENTYFYWIDNLRDWCISRQLWWGHRIPIWYNIDNPDEMICSDSDTPPQQVLENPTKWKQDDDVLDTWFSSALWPFATLGWPEKTKELEKFYPTAVLITGHDILFFWVARMMMMGRYAMGKAPFAETFLHGLIYGKSYWRQNAGGGITYVTPEERKEFELGKPVPKDVHFKWEKMSKTKGNIIDPLEVIEIYGTDAMRMALCSSASQAREIDLDLRKFEEFKNFANKVWNGARFVMMNLSSDALNEPLDLESLSLEDRWILSVLQRTVREVQKHLAEYQFDMAALAAYDFFWKEFCASYVEISKPALSGKMGDKAKKTKQKILAIVLCQAIRLMHPMAPFITEELFQHMKGMLEVNSSAALDPFTSEAARALSGISCAVSPYPQIIDEKMIDEQVEEKFKEILETVYVIRNIRGEMKIPPGTPSDVHFTRPNANLKDNSALISALVRIKGIYFHEVEPSLGICSQAFVNGTTVSVPIPEELTRQELARLEKEAPKIEQTILRLQNQLGNEEFIKNAPAELVEKLKNSLKTARDEFTAVQEKIKTLQSV